jgi:hypothetical protein
MILSTSWEIQKNARVYNKRSSFKIRRGNCNTYVRIKAKTMLTFLLKNKPIKRSTSKF